MDGAQGFWSFQETKEKILSADPSLLCINAVYFWEHTILFFDFLDDLKKEGFTGHINLFGFFPTLVYGEILERVAAAGFNSLLMGIESGSEKVLGNLNKQSAAQEGAGAIALCRAHGIEPEIGFLMFVPDSSWVIGTGQLGSLRSRAGPIARRGGRHSTIFVICCVGKPT